MFENNDTGIEGVKLIGANPSVDLRGKFFKFYPNKLLEDALGSVAVSINPTVGTIRGLHFQVEPLAEEKIVSCIQGSTFEVILDIRIDSKTFGKFSTFELSQENSKYVYLPKGIAHGFQTLLPDTIVQYFLTSDYSEKYSYAVDPFGDLDIDWPIKDYVISEKDLRGVTFDYAAKMFSKALEM